MPLSDSPIQMPAKRFSADQKEHRANNQAIEQFGNIASYGFVPIGGVLPFAGVSAPPGYLLCDGSAVSRTTYGALFSVIGTSYGVGDGSTTFNVPNFTSRGIVQGSPGGTSTLVTSVTGGTTIVSLFVNFIIRTGAV